MATFQNYKKELTKGARKLAQKVVGDFEEAAIADTHAFFKKSERDLKRWTRLLEAGEITNQDFTDLVQARKSLAELHELTQKGIALTKLDRFRKNLISLVIDTAVKVYL